MQLIRELRSQKDCEAMLRSVTSESQHHPWLKDRGRSRWGQLKEPGDEPLTLSVGSWTTEVMQLFLTTYR